MFQLAVATGPDWTERVLAHLDDVLIEQAHLEKKAAAAALNLLFRYPEHVELQVPLSQLAREELTHFESILAILAQRGVPFGRQQPTAYAQELTKIIGTAEPERLLDSMLCCAVIEARSCERMKLLAQALQSREPVLAQTYAELVQSEARHHALYVRLARQLFAADRVDDRLQQVLVHEANVLTRLPKSARLHA